MMNKTGVKEEIIRILPKMEHAIHVHFGNRDILITNAFCQLKAWLDGDVILAAVEQQFEFLKNRVLSTDPFGPYSTDLALYYILRSTISRRAEDIVAAEIYLDRIEPVAMLEDSSRDDLLYSFAACDSIDAFVLLRDKARKMLDSQDAL